MKFKLKHAVLCTLVFSCSLLSAATNDFVLLRQDPNLHWRDIQIADLDLDGDDDFVMVTTVLKIVWMENGLPESFSQYNLTSLALSVAIGDLNGDNYPDIAVGTHDGNYNFDKLYYNQNGQGFAPAYTLTPPDAGYYGPGYDPEMTPEIGIFDVNGDHRNDVVTIYKSHLTPNSKERYLRVWINQGDGTYAIGMTGYNLTPGAGQSGKTDQGMQLSHGKFDNNDSEDLLVTNEYYSALYLNDGAGNFTRTTLLNTQDKPYSHSVGDLNNDGHLDLVTASLISTNPTSTPAAVYFWPGNGDGTFAARSILFNNPSVHKLDIGDVDHDGNLDIFLSEPNNKMRVYFGNGNLGFVRFGTLLAGGFAYPGDYDGDGYLDLTVQNHTAGSNTPYNDFRYYKIDLSTDAPLYIPDSLLKAFLVGQYDSDSDGELSRNEAANVTGEINISGLGIQDLTGIDAFTGISKLTANNNQIRKVPQIRATNLTHFWLQNNQLASVPSFALLPNLKSIYLSNNALSMIPSLAQNTELTELYLQSNQITSLPNLSFLDQLRYANFSENQLTQIPSLSNATSLRHLRMRDNQLTQLPSLAGLSNLSVITADQNQLTSLPDLSGLSLLTQLYVQSNQLTTLPSFNDLTSLQSFNCNTNQITSLPSMSSLGNLTSLIAYDNQLTTLPDLSSNRLLTELRLHKNLLSEVPDISNNSSLAIFYLYYNNLDTDDCPEITSVEQESQIGSFIYNPSNGGSYISCP